MHNADNSPRKHRNSAVIAGSLSLAAAFTLTACGGGGAGSGSRMDLTEASNGFGRLLPHRIYVADGNGLPTNQLLEIRDIQDLKDNATSTNGILPPIEWPLTAKLPNGDAGNHFIYARFTQPIDVNSVLDGAVSAGNAYNLTGTIAVESVDSTGTVTLVPGRAFVGGYTYGSVDPADSSRLLLEEWIGSANGLPSALDVNGETPGLGFPGTQSTTSFSGGLDLVSPNTFVFIPDIDGELTSLETFRTDAQIRIRITKSVLAVNGGALRDAGVALATVGPDTIPIEVGNAASDPAILPFDGALDVDPETSILVEFTEPIQIRSLGEFDDGTAPVLSAAIQIEFGPDGGRVQVPFHVNIESPFDLTHIELIPTYNFPGSGPIIDGLSCGSFSEIEVSINPDQFSDLSGNLNSSSPSISFTTAEGPGIVNAPVTPDTIYVNRGGSNPGISVIDLNGFGQGPGNPTYDLNNPIIEGNTNFRNNPNLALQGSIMIPSLTAGVCVFDGGSPGVFSLATDTSLNDRLIASPLLTAPSDMALGWALDLTFNNSLPFGCQAGGGNICSQTGLKIVIVASGGPSTLAPGAAGGNVPVKTVIGGPNFANWAPHPNPPPLIFPPLCLSPLLAAQEPSSIDLPLMLPPVQNLLSPGSSPLGNPDLGLAPNGILALEQNAFFQGPSPPQTSIQACNAYGIRQQIGHFLYVADRGSNEVVVLNSNRFTVIDRILVPDPTSLAMGPNLDLLAVTSSSADLVTFIDTDPSSSTFHQIVKVTPVGSGPTGIAWEGGNEDILVVNTQEGSMSVISAFSLNVRKTVTSQISNPIDVAITPRQGTFGFLRGVYFAYILNGDGSVAVFESGPDGVNGWGFDDVIGVPSYRFPRPKAIQPDILDLRSAIWVVHEDPLDTAGLPTGLGGGAISNMAITGGTSGQIPLASGAFGNPGIRDIQWSIKVSIGEGPNGLTGIPTDIAFDNQRNLAPLTNFSTVFSAGVAANVNGKSIVRVNAGPAPTTNPQFIFLSVPISDEGPGVVDVVSLNGLRRFDTNPFLTGVQSIPCSDAVSLMDYFRQ